MVLRISLSVQKWILLVNRAREPRRYVGCAREGMSGGETRPALDVSEKERVRMDRALMLEVAGKERPGINPGPTKSQY